LSLMPQKNKTAETKWEWVKLGKVVEILIGGTPSRSIKKYFEGENLWVSIAEMNGDIIVDTKEKITDEGVKNSNVKLIPKGTTLLSFKLSIGKTAIAGANLYTNEAVAGLIPKDETIISNAFLFHLFNTKQIDLSTGNNAIGQSLNSKYLKEELKIPLPPLSIQQQMVAECEVIETEVGGAFKLIEEANKKIESHVRGWFRNNFEMQKVEKVFSLEYGKNLPEAKRVIGDYPVMGSNGITGYHNEYLVEAPAIIVGRKGSAGKITYIDKNCYPIDTTFYVNPKLPCSIKYLYYVLLELKLDTMIRGSGVPGINRNDIYQLIIPVPSLSDQEKRVAEIENLEQSIHAARQVIHDAPRQKQAIMTKYL